MTLAGVPVADVGDLQRLMDAEAIGRPLTVVMIRRGELIEVEVVPEELGAELAPVTCAAGGGRATTAAASGKAPLSSRT